MATRIGKYIFEDTLEEMSIEKLQYLKEACDHFINEKRRKEVEDTFTELNLRAHAFGFDLCFVNPDDHDDKYILNQYNFEVVKRDI